MLFVFWIWSGDLLCLEFGMMILGCVWWKLHEKTKEKFMIHVLYGFHRYYHRCLIDRFPIWSFRSYFTCGDDSLRKRTPSTFLQLLQRWITSIQIKFPDQVLWFHIKWFWGSFNIVMNVLLKVSRMTVDCLQTHFGW